MGKKDAKAKSIKKGKATKKGGIVNLPEDNSDHSELEEVQEVDQEKSQEKEKIPREYRNRHRKRHSQKRLVKRGMTNFPT